MRVRLAWLGLLLSLAGCYRTSGNPPDDAAVPRDAATPDDPSIDVPSCDEWCWFDGAPIVGLDAASARSVWAIDEGGNARLHAQWRAGDADGMWESLGGELQRDYPKLYRRIDVDRNLAWLPAIEQRLQGPADDDTLVVVGALHLLGPDGLVERLRAAGYEVRRICAACDAAETASGTARTAQAR